MRTHACTAVTLLAILFGAAPSAIAVTYFTGADAMSWCDRTGPGESRESSERLGACFAFLGASAGAAGTLDHWGYRHERAGRPDASCVPSGVTLGQLRQAWLAHVEAHQGDLGLDASSLALNAFESAWPCQ